MGRQLPESPVGPDGKAVESRRSGEAAEADLLGEVIDSGAVQRVLEPRDERSTAATLAAWRILTQQEETAALVRSGEAAFDVPFSFVDSPENRVVRGSIDVVIRRPDGTIEVIALETGPPVPDHEQRLTLSVAAARRLFPGAAVNGRTHYWRV